MSNEEKLSSAVKLAQSYILLFLKENISSEQILNVERLFIDCPVVIENIKNETNEFGKTTSVGGISQNDKISIGLNDIEKTNINNETERNKLLGTIIHEYAHKIRAINNEYGEMFEESFSSIFAEVCINNARLKTGDKEDNKEIFEMLDSVEYQKFESQARGLLYLLKQNNYDYRLIAEYIAGNEEYFKQTCTQILGDNFMDYYNSISSKNNAESEEKLINLIVQYIRNNGLNISDYWSKDSNKLMSNNLYFRGSPTLCKGVVMAGKQSFKPEEQDFYKYYESSVELANENNNTINQEKIDRIKQYISVNFSLEGKSLEEVYDTIIDLCSTYIQHQNKEDEESKIFIEEIKKIIPDIDGFKTKFVNLRVAGLDKKIFESLDLNNISYDDIISNMDKLLNLEKPESGFTR